MKSAPPAPRFDAETWRRMVELVKFLRVHEMPVEVQGCVGQAIVRLRLREARSGQPTGGSPGRRSPSASDRPQ